MEKLLVVVDMQNDFIDGSLGTPEAVAIVPNVVNKILGWNGDIILTKDTHQATYLETKEGQKLPVPHCIEGTPGFEINNSVHEATLQNRYCYRAYIRKSTFGSVAMAEQLKGLGYDYIELVGLCTDICVVSNALMLKAYLPETDIAVDASCCAGVTPESHKAALLTMKMCQIDVIGESSQNN